MQATRTVASVDSASTPRAKQSELSRRERDQATRDDACTECSEQPRHDFGRVAVHERASVSPQPKLVVGAPGDRFEQEADAAAERVMRASADGASPHCSQCASEDDGERIQRQLESPYSVDDGIVTPLAGESEDDSELPAVQAKEASLAGPAPIASTATRAIQALRGGGAPLPAPTRAFMETRFGHDFGRVRVHTGNDADAAARSLHARAFTLGRDIVFGAGQFAAKSADGQRLLAHELAHVIQQGQAPRAGAVATELDAEVVRCVQWTPNKPTGKSSAPWGPGNPTGKLLKAKTDAGTALDIWRPDDNTTYWCHGFTFGGSVAKGGPYSIFGSDVPTVLKDDGWQQTLSCMAQPKDILVIWDAQGLVAHSGVINTVSTSGSKVDDATSTLDSKWGAGSQNTKTWEVNAKKYGRYRCFSKAPLTGVCSDKGANEI